MPRSPKAERTLPRHPSVRSAIYSNGGLRVSLWTGETVIVRSIEDLNDLKRQLAKPAGKGAGSPAAKRSNR